MTPARTIFLTVVLALAVAVLERGLIRLVDASGAKDQPAVILVLLLSAFLGLLTAVLTRSMRLPSAIAPTAQTGRTYHRGWSKATMNETRYKLSGIIHSKGTVATF